MQITKYLKNFYCKPQSYYKVAFKGKSREKFKNMKEYSIF